MSSDTVKVLTDGETAIEELARNVRDRLFTKEESEPVKRKIPAKNFLLSLANHDGSIVMLPIEKILTNLDI